MTGVQTCALPIYWEGQVIATPIVNGNYAVTVTRCNASTAPLEVIALDIATMQQSTPWVGASNVAGVVSTGSITACSVSTEQWINYSINGGVMYSMIAPADSVAQDPNGTNSSVFSGFSNISNAGAITFSVSNPLSLGNGQTFTGLTCTNIENGQSTLTIALSSPLTITEYGSIGEFIAGNGVVTVNSSLGNVYSVFIDFRIKRAY